MTGGAVLPAPLSSGVTYYVRDVVGTFFKLSATLGGPAIDLTTDLSADPTAGKFAYLKVMNGMQVSHAGISKSVFYNGWSGNNNAIAYDDGISGNALTTGSFFGNFTGATGYYDLKLNYFDLSSGITKLTIKVNGNAVDTWLTNRNYGLGPFADASTRASHTTTGIRVASNDLIEVIMETATGQEILTVDSLIFLPA